MPDERGTTSATLLERVRDPEDAEAWRRFFTLYAPLLARYARAHGLRGADALEVRDECLAEVTRKMPRFRYASERGRFRSWLHVIARGRVIDRLRQRSLAAAPGHVLDRLSSSDPTPDEAWERAWRHEHLRWALEQVRGSVSERAYTIFSLLVFEGLEVEEVRARLGLNANQVYLAKSRVLRRVRELLRREGLADE